MRLEEALPLSRQGKRFRLKNGSPEFRELSELPLGINFEYEVESEDKRKWKAYWVEQKGEQFLKRTRAIESDVHSNCSRAPEFDEP